MAKQMIGRDVERAALRAALASARRARGQALLVVGEPGVGKSMLLEDLAEFATSAGVSVLRGRAVEGAGTFRPFAEALMPVVRTRAWPLSPRLRPYRAALGRLIPDWATATPAEADLDPILVLGEGLLRLLGELDPAGCVVLLEDLHWADPESLALLDYLSSAVTSASVLVVASTRERLGTPDRVVAPGASVLTLGRLAQAEIDAMISSRDRVVSATDRTSIRNRSEGLPLLVEELLASRSDDGGWRVPATFAALVEQRFTALDERGRRLLAAAAALGLEPDWDLVPEIADVDSAEAVANLREAVRMDLLTASGPGLTWRHALTRDAVWDGLLPQERTALGRRAADVLLARGGPARQPAAAELLISAGDHARGGALLLEMARRELATGAVHRAETLLDRVAETGNLPEGWASSRVDLLTLTGRLDEALSTGSRALERATGAEHVDLCFRLARVSIQLTQWPEADSYVARARRPDDPRSLILLADSAHGAGEVDQAAELAARAVRLADEAGDADLRCEALIVHARILRLSEVDRSEELFRQAADLAAEHGLKPRRVEALLGVGLVESLRDEDSPRLVEAQELATDLGLLATASDVELILADRAWVTAGPRAATEHAERLIESGRLLRRPSTRVVGEMIIATGQVLRGDRPAEPREGFDQDAGPELDMQRRALASTIALADHDLTEATAQLDAGFGPLLSHRSIAPLHQFGLWALLRAITGQESDAARESLRRSPVVLRRTNEGALRFADAVADGRAGRRGDAEGAYADGDAILAPVPWWQRFLRLFTLECALDDGWGDPVPQLRADLAAHEATGDERLARICRDLLRRAGAPTRRGRGDATVPPALRARRITSRELDVLQLVARGRSNGEAAEQLFLSVRTVETHVASLLAKSGAANRTELRAWYAGLTR